MKWTGAEGLAKQMMEIVEKCQRQRGTQIIVQELVYNRLAELRVHVLHSLSRKSAKQVGM